MKKFIYQNDYEIRTKNKNKFIKQCSMNKNLAKVDIIESVAEDIQKFEGDMWYKINKCWYGASDLKVHTHRQKFDMDKNLVEVKDFFLQH